MTKKKEIAMHFREYVCLSLILFCLALPGAATQAQELKIEKGFDLFRTLPEFESEQGFGECPIPGQTFEIHSDELLTGCETFDGFVRLRGAPLEKFQGVTVGAIDTIVERKETLDFGEPEDDVTLPIDVELVALNLVSASPVEIQCDQGLTLWDVAVEVDPSTGPSEGQMEVTLDYPGLAGGTVSSELNICPRVTFTRADAGGSGSFEIFPCDLLCGPQLIGETAWAFELPEGATETLKIDGFTTDNFFFVDRPAGAAPVNKLFTLLQGTKAEVLDCECGFLYPHLSANHRHQACAPCPCDADIVAPTLEVPAEPVPPFECTGKDANGQGGIPKTDPDVADWLSSAICMDETSPIKFCGPVNPPDFFSLGPPENPPMHCVGKTPVDFQAEDKCKNKTPLVPATMAVQDTTGAVIVPGAGDFDCLSPPNGGVYCFVQGEGSFDFDTIKKSFTDDLCSEVADWWFVDCASDQEGTGDCTVAPDKRSFCVRSERDGSIPEGRRYAVEIRAEDECGNVGSSEVIGFIHVPINDPNKECIDVKPPVKPACGATPTTGEAPLTVSFTDESKVTSSTIISWEWDFDGDGVIDSTVQNPTFTYLGAGSFTPILTIKIDDSDLPFSATCPPITVTSPPPPWTATCLRWKSATATRKKSRCRSRSRTRTTSWRRSTSRTSSKTNPSTRSMAMAKLFAPTREWRPTTGATRRSSWPSEPELARAESTSSPSLPPEKTAADAAAARGR